MFSINNKNQFEQFQYIEDKNGTINYLTDERTIWTIKNPSENTIKWYSENLNSVILRKYLNNDYLMSSLAAEKIKEYGSGQGEACIIKFSIKNENYFLLTIDNKPYVQNVQGLKEKNDKEEGDCIVRELKEECNISITKDQLKKIGEWSFTSSNNLVDSAWSAQTILFYIEPKFEQIQHLIKNIEFKTDDFTIIDVNSYDFKLDETKYVVIIPEKTMIDIPDSIFNHKFNNHHRECIHKLLRLSKSYSINYLNSFTVEM